MAPDDEAVRLQLDRILSSPEIKGKKTLASFLRFIVEQTLAGYSHQIKGLTVATQALGRKESFDAVRDPTVRILAGKLRASLEHYYLTRGSKDPVLIEVPKGTYVPIFHDLSAKELREQRSAPGGIQPREGESSLGPAIAVMPLTNLSNGSEQDYFADGLTEEMIAEVARYPELKVIALHSVMKFKGMPVSAREVGRELNVRFLLEGSVRTEGSRMKVTVRLIDTTPQTQIWGEQYLRDYTVGNLIHLQEEIASRVAARIGSLYGIIPQKLSTELRARAPRSLETYEALLCFHQYSMHLTEPLHRETLEILDSHCEKDSELGMLWALLAVLHADANSLWHPRPQATMETAVAYARRGVALEPQNQYARTVLAYMYFLVGERHAFFHEAERAIALNPNSPMHIGFLGWAMALYGEQKRGLSLLERGIELNPYYPGWFHAGPSLLHYAVGHYEDAYEQAEKIRMPHILWDPLLRAAILGQLGRSAEARRALDRLLQVRPDFAANARRLLGYFIKNGEQVDHMLEGLEKAGLTI